MASPIRVLAAALALGCAVCAGAAAAQTPAAKPPPAKAEDLVIPCDLPKDAPQAVPAPFDRYMSLACTAQGEALRPPAGYYWMFPQGPMWLLAPKGYYRELAVTPLTDRALADLRAELHKVTSEPTVFTRQIIRMDVTLSTGEHRQEFLFLPPPGDPEPMDVLGMECIHFCIPIEKDPWFFEMRREAPPKP